MKDWWTLGPKAPRVHGVRAYSCPCCKPAHPKKDWRRVVVRRRRALDRDLERNWD